MCGICLKILFESLMNMTGKIRMDAQTKRIQFENLSCKSHKFTGTINWKPGDYDNFPMIKNTIEGHYLQTAMGYIFMHVIFTLYSKHFPEV